jgi:hypothetical protein
MSHSVHSCFGFPNVFTVSLADLVARAPLGNLTELYVNVLESTFSHAEANARHNPGQTPLSAPLPSERLWPLPPSPMDPAMPGVPKSTLPLPFVYGNPPVTRLNVDSRVLVQCNASLTFRTARLFLLGINIIGGSALRIWGMSSVLWCCWKRTEEDATSIDSTHGRLLRGGDALHFPSGIRVRGPTRFATSSIKQPDAQT